MQQKALFVCHRYTPYPGGIEYVTDQQVGFFAKQGYATTVICMNEHLTKKVSRTGRHGERIFEYPAHGPFFSALFSLRYTFNVLIRHFIEKPKRLAITFPGALDTLIASICVLLRPCELVMTVHADVVNKPVAFKYLIHRLFFFLSRKADVVLFDSHSLQQHFLKRYPGATNFEVCLIGWDNKSNALEKNFDNEKLKLLFIGRLVEYKGLDILLESLAHVEDATLKIAGDGPLRRTLEAQTQRLKLEKRVEFVGFVTESQKQDLLRYSDVFVLPSKTEAEAFGIVQLEALSEGLPVINTDLPTYVPKISQHMVSGLTVKPNDALSLAHAIERLAKDRNLLAQLSKGTQGQIHRFSIDTVRERFNRLVFKVM